MNIEILRIIIISISAVKFDRLGHSSSGKFEIALESSVTLLGECKQTIDFREFNLSCMNFLKV